MLERRSASKLAASRWRLEISHTMLFALPFQPQVRSKSGATHAHFLTGPVYRMRNLSNPTIRNYAEQGITDSDMYRGVSVSCWSTRVYGFTSF